ncbi:transcription termination/antitermination NusG family protein [Photorhabdus khanii]|uniref:transcription termination/antitermination NusG family protein n=1 Tax=Photorhabdus khanii TaxID=1004150 RepID=UPI0004B10CFC|nr:transcription termination/antitermination NusG family protein [Photorhabdus khanii]
MKSWYILYHHERRSPSIMNTLSREGVECYMPVRECFVPRPDRKSLRRAKPKALFPCYMFVFFNPEDIHTTKISAIDGAIGFVRFGSYPCKVPESIIAELKLCRPEMLSANNKCLEFRNPPDILSENIHLLSSVLAGKLKREIRKVIEIPDGHLRLMALFDLIGISEQHTRLYDLRLM